jgi:8-oxo-dGTP diphosphatase
MKTIAVVAAIIYEGNKFFATQRGYGAWKDYWEFPGGKIELGESPEEALCREIFEELDTKICVGEKLTSVEYDYSEFHLSMQCFWATVVEGSLVLKEHESAKWLKKEELNSVNWLPADRIVIDFLEKSDLR